MNFSSIFFRGMAMGICDVIPGISGGTIALITGIYERLITALSGLNKTFLAYLLRGSWKKAWKTVDGNFLFPLLLGVGFAILTFSHVVGMLLYYAPTVVWSFFFGLIVMAGLLMWRHIPRFAYKESLLLMLGGVLGLSVSLFSGASLPEGLFYYGVSGAIAICAMLLPGISGSMILLLLGKYTGILAAVRSFDLPILIVTALGCLLGLIVFARVVKHALQKAPGMTMAFFLGVLIGTLPKVWPWKLPLTMFVKEEGALLPIDALQVTPHDMKMLFAKGDLVVTKEQFLWPWEASDPLLLVALVALVLGILLPYLLDRLGRKA